LKLFLDSLLDIFYDISFTQDKITLTSKITEISNSFWSSEENTKEFNTHIPNFKSIHKDMYHLIESIVIFKSGDFDIESFESKYPIFKEFRLLNNIFKHPKKKSIEISFTKIAHINQKQFDLMCNFKAQDSFKCLMYSEFIVLFITILKDLNFIKIIKCHSK